MFVDFHFSDDDVFGFFCLHLPVIAFLSFLLFWSRQIVRSRVFILLFFLYLLVRESPLKSKHAGSEAIGSTSSFSFLSLLLFYAGGIFLQLAVLRDKSNGIRL